MLKLIVFITFVFCAMGAYSDHVVRTEQKEKRRQEAIALKAKEDAKFAQYYKGVTTK